AHFETHESADRLAVFLSDRRPQKHASFARQQLADPAAPDNGVTAPHEKAIPLAAGLVEIVAAGRAIEELQRQLAAAVVDVVEDGAVAFGGVAGGKDEHVACAFDHASAIPRRQLE